MLLCKAQRAVHAAGFVAVHAASHQHAGQAGLPGVAAQGLQGEVLGRVMGVGIGHLAVGLHIPLVAQGVDGAQHVVGMAALAHLARAPLVAFGVAPGLAGHADGVRGGGLHGCVGRYEKNPWPTGPGQVAERS